jgi:hypothetical protein
VHEGGIRVPFFVRWPGKLKAGRVVDRIAAHIDLAPTLLEACNLPKPNGVSFDGKSLWPLLLGKKVEWPDRMLCVQWHRGDEPELYRAFAARSQRYKLVQPLGAGTNAPAKPDFKLYDMLDDPLETHNIAVERPDLVKQLRRGYERWFADVSSTRGYAPPRIYLGAQENPIWLTRQDWRGPRAGWGTNSLGHWEVQVAQDGLYDIRLRFPAVTNSCTAHFSLRDVALNQSVDAGAAECAFKAVRLTTGASRVEAWIQEDRRTLGVHYVEISRVGR